MANNVEIINNNMQTSNATFKVYDHNDQETTQTYSFEQTYLKIVPDLGDEYVDNIEWVFGDGTTSREFSPTKYYDRAGTYRIQLILFDCDNLAIYSTFSVTVTITDFFDMHFDLLSSASIETLSAGIISDAFAINVTIPHYQQDIDINYHVDNSENSKAWRDIQEFRYAHLDMYYTMYKKIRNYSLDDFQYEKIPTISFDYTKLYAKLDNSGQVVQSHETEVGSFYAGSSATKDVYFSHDTPQDDLVLAFYFDNDQYSFSESYKIQSNVHNSTFLKLDVTCVHAASGASASDIQYKATSNGLIGEGLEVDTFKVSDFKFINTPFQFVITARNPVDTNYTLKSKSVDFDGDNPIFDGDILGLYNMGSPLPLSSYTLKEVDLGSESQWYKAYHITFKDVDHDDYLDIDIEYGSSQVNDTVSTRVYKKQPYSLYKKGEEFSPKETIKSLRFQEVMLNKPKLFDELIGSVMGDEGGDVLNNFGVKTHEKIQNYNNNLVNIDKCHIFALNSANDMLGRNIDRFDSSLQNFPDAIGRYANLFSIDDGSLIGYKNTFQENFNARGDSTKTTYGINLGDEIDMYTYTCSAETDIVAYEKFSDVFTRLNTSQPVSSVGAHTYALSSYNDDFGWGLVLPSGYEADDIPKFYRFFEFIPDIDGTILNSTINFDFEQTNVSYDDFKNLKSGQYNMFDVLMYDTLTDVLSTRVFE